jgi:hypothetical protein
MQQQQRFRLGRLAASIGLAALVASCAQQRSYLKDSSARITEVHFDPSVEQGKVEFIEIGNASKEPVDLSGWQVTGAGRVSIPTGTVIPPGGAVVLSEDAAAFTKAFGASVKSVAPLSGKLKKSGETVRLEDPQGSVADEVSYDATVPEVLKASNTGQSLHRMSGPASGGAATEWKAGAPTPGKV